MTKETVEVFRNEIVELGSEAHDVLDKSGHTSGAEENGRGRDAPKRRDTVKNRLQASRRSPCDYVQRAPAWRLFLDRYQNPRL